MSFLSNKKFIFKYTLEKPTPMKNPTYACFTEKYRLRHFCTSISPTQINFCRINTNFFFLVVERELFFFLNNSHR